VTIRARHLVICLATLAALAIPASANASPQQVIRDCVQDGVLDHHYSNKDLVKARDTLPSDVDEYSDCHEVIAAAIGPPGKGHGSKGGGGGGADAASPGSQQAAKTQDDRALREATKPSAPPEVTVDGKKVAPGKNGLFNLASAENGIPLPLLLALIAVGILAAGGALWALRRRVPALANISLPRRISLGRVLPFPRPRR
jgi:hypothetical protein